MHRDSEFCSPAVLNCSRVDSERTCADLQSVIFSRIGQILYKD